MTAWLAGHLCWFLVSHTEKAKKFLTDFYADSDEGKVFTYAEQLVRLQHPIYLIHKHTVASAVCVCCVCVWVWVCVCVCACVHALKCIVIIPFFIDWVSSQRTSAACHWPGWCGWGMLVVTVAVEHTMDLSATLSPSFTLSSMTMNWLKLLHRTHDAMWRYFQRLYQNSCQCTSKRK